MSTSDDAAEQERLINAVDVWNVSIDMQHLADYCGRRLRMHRTPFCSWTHQDEVAARNEETDSVSSIASKPPLNSPDFTPAIAAARNWEYLVLLTEEVLDALKDIHNRGRTLVPDDLMWLSRDVTHVTHRILHEGQVRRMLQSGWVADESRPALDRRNQIIKRIRWILRRVDIVCARDLYGASIRLIAAGHAILHPAGSKNAIPPADLNPIVLAMCRQHIATNPAGRAVKWGLVAKAIRKNRDTTLACMRYLHSIGECDAHR